MISELRKLVKRAFHGFPDRYVTRVGEIVALHDYPGSTAVGTGEDAEQATDRYRPRLAVSVQILTPQGEPDDARPVIEGLPLPASMAMALPAIGERVRVGYDYGSPAHPYIAGLLSEGRHLPAVAPDERRLDLGEGAFLRRDAAGNITLQADGKITLDCADLHLVAGHLTEALGAVQRSVAGDVVENIEGSRVTQILGALKESVGGDVRRAVLGSMDETVGGDRAELTGGARELVAADAYRVLAASLAMGNGVQELLAIIDALATALQAETHGTGVGPTTVPSNAADYTTQQTQLGLIKE